MDLPANQLSLLQRVSAVNDSVVVVLVGGSTVQMSTWDHRAAAILELLAVGAGLRRGGGRPAHRGGQPVRQAGRDHPRPAGGQLLLPQLPRRSRGGALRRGCLRRLPRATTSPRSTSATPSATGSRTPRSPSAASPRRSPGRWPAATCPWRSAPRSPTPARSAGAEVVQVYVGDLESEVARPVRELKGFAKVGAGAGCVDDVTIDLDERAFAYWSQRLGRWAVEAGEFEIAVGSSSRDIADQVVLSIDAPSVAGPAGCRLDAARVAGRRPRPGAAVRRARGRHDPGRTRS